VVLHHEPPPGAAEAKREAAQAPAVVELGADDARRSSVARAAGEGQGAERNRGSGPREVHTIAAYIVCRAGGQGCEDGALEEMGGVRGENR
jgi:hypothetical protein